MPALTFSILCPGVPVFYQYLGEKYNQPKNSKFFRLNLKCSNVNV